MLKWDRSALTATNNIYLCTSWNKVPLWSKGNCNFPQCLQQDFGQIWTQYCLCLRLQVNGSTADWPRTFTWLQQLWTYRGIRETLERGWTGRVPSYPLSVLEPSTLNSSGIRKSFWRSTWVQWLCTIALRRNCTCQLLSRSLVRCCRVSGSGSDLRHSLRWLSTTSLCSSGFNRSPSRGLRPALTESW